LIIQSHAQIKPLTSKQIDSLVSKSMEMMPLAGVAVAVVKDGKVIHAKGYGVNSVQSKEKTDDNSLFAIASNSKAFTTMALGILVDEGKIKWQDKVVDYIPEFRMYDPYVTANFTIVDLLTHRSGLGLGAGDLMFFPAGSDFTIKDVMKSFQYQKPTSAFRTKYDYDNLLYMVAGELVGRVSGMNWATYVETKIMKPLGMTHSAALYQNIKDKKNVAMPHGVKADALTQIETYTNSDPTFGAAGGIYASVNDLSKWMLLHLNSGKYGDGLKSQLVSPGNHRQMQRPQTIVGFNARPNPPVKSHFYAYGLGWFINDRNGNIQFSHTGGLPGMLSQIILLPELNLGVVVLSNTDPGGYIFDWLPNAIVDSYNNVKIDRITQASASLKERGAESDSVTTAVWNIVKTAKTDLKLENFTGTYHDNWFGDITISLKDGQLWFTSLHSPKLHGKMSFYKANTFAIYWDYQEMECNAFATFSLDEEGNATGIKMRAISPSADFSFDFHDLDLKKVDK
jgi:CubicO group peptidase (beta-lactamase class C family)